MTDKAFEEFLIQCNKESHTKQKLLIEKYHINAYTRYYFSQKERCLELKKDNGESLKLDIVCIGTWGYEDKTWVWAWSNVNLNEELRKQSTKLKELAKETGFELFTKEGFECEEAVARDLAFIGVHQLKAQGIYRIEVDKSYLFLGIMKVYQ